MARGVFSELLPYLGLFGQVFLFFQIEDFNTRTALVGFTIFSVGHFTAFKWKIPILLNPRILNIHFT